MGHYRPERPKLFQDPMKPVEVTFAAVDRINRRPPLGFSTWAPHIPSPDEFFRRHVRRQRALNRFVEPRFGISLLDAQNHTRSVKAMVSRILKQDSAAERRKNAGNVNTHPAYLRRPVTDPPHRSGKRRKKREERHVEASHSKPWYSSTVTDWLFQSSPHGKFAAPRRPSFKAPKRKRPGVVTVRQGTPFCFTPKASTKLIDGTHLCGRAEYDDAKAESRKRYFEVQNGPPRDPMTRIGSDNAALKHIYAEVVHTPNGLSCLSTGHWSPPASIRPGAEPYGPNWRYDMRRHVLPCDLKLTPSAHAIDDPIRPSSSRCPYFDPFVEPQVLYDIDEEGDLSPIAPPTTPNYYFSRFRSGPSSKASGKFPCRSSDEALAHELADLTESYLSIYSKSNPTKSAPKPRADASSGERSCSAFQRWKDGKDDGRNGSNATSSGLLAPSNSLSTSPRASNWSGRSWGSGDPLGEELSSRFGGLIRNPPSSYDSPNSSDFDESGADTPPPFSYKKGPYAPEDEPSWTQPPCCEAP